jgi:putative pyoverdin transport system ATP-binding/permease protein
MSPPGSAHRRSAFADARTSIGDLLALIIAESRYSKLAWAAWIGLVAVPSVLVLHIATETISAKDGSLASLARLLLFWLALFINWLPQLKVAQRVLEALTSAVSRTTQRIIRAMSRLDLEQFEAVGEAEIIGRVSDDAGRIAPGSALIVQVVVGAATVVLSMLYLATISVAAAGLSFAAMAVLTVLGSRINQQVLAQIERDQAAYRRMQEPIDDLLAGFKQLKQHRPRSAAVAATFDAEATALKSSRAAYHSEYYASDTLSRHSFFAMLGAISFILPMVVPEVASQTSRLMMAVTFTFQPFATVGMATPLLAQIGSAWQRLASLADRLDAMAGAEVEVEPAEPSEPTAPPRPFVKLTLRQVTYRYPSQDLRPGFAVGPLDLELVPGEIVFITGANGSGKSTFVKLLCGLYRRHGGELLVDGSLLPRDPGASWRNRFAVVFAEFALFDQLYGLQDVEPTRVAALLDRMELGHKVRFAQGRFDTVELSTGQRKRLALVVALLQDRPIYVFDEWAADQDPHFREAFYRVILPELKVRGKTVVAVTHDDDAFDTCDRRLHFADGHMERA